MKANNRPRVVITGISVCCPNGQDVETFWNNSLTGKSGVVKLDTFPIQRGYGRAAGVVKGFRSETLFRPGRPVDWPDRAQRMAEHCVRLILEAAGLKEKQVETCAFYLSSAIGQMGSMEQFFSAQERKVGSPEDRGIFSFNSLPGRIATQFGLRGGHLLLPTGCVGGCDSVAYGYRLIKSGSVRRAIVGAVEAPLTPLVVAAFGRISATSKRDCAPHEASCPFDQRRDGFVLAEGAAMLVLEPEWAAVSRGAKILGEVSGCGSLNNCFHMTDINPDGESIAEACRLALLDAKVDCSEIDFVNSHGSSTPQNDLAESAALRKVFGKRIWDIPVTSLKSQIGHALSAANAIEIVSTVKSINHSEIPPTINVEQQDPDCGVTLVANKRASHRIRKALKISSGFSGIHTALILSEYQS
jgi:3-oxoacyl-(acyl-carrier-protein) synthase